ncbi:corticosteroid- binding protein [Chamberlinius hualienensis]
MNAVWLSIVFLFHFNTVSAENETLANYTGCELISLKPQTNDEKEHLMSLLLLANFHKSNIPGLEFWEDPSDNQRPISIQLCPGSPQIFVNRLKNITHTVEIPDIQNLIDEQAAELELLGRFEANTGSADFSLDQYHNLGEIENLFEVLSQEYPEKVKIVKIGTTLLGNDLKVVQVSDNESNVTKPIIWIDSGIHAREWVSIASSVYLIHQMVTTNSSLSQNLLRDFDWHFMPVGNPDGYRYSWTHDRLWRKNRSFNSPFCRGVDINRNFDVDFKGGGILASFVCSQDYRGLSPFSERESKAIRQYLTEIKNQLKVYVSLHSYGQLFLHPYGFQRAKPKHYSSVNRLAQLAVSAIKEAGQIQYTPGSINSQLYHVSGSSTDWVYEMLGIQYSYVMELRDKGQYGFLLPRSQILPTAKDVAAALEAIVNNIDAKVDQ